MVRSSLAQKRPPLDLSARMAVCDANYLRLLKLLPAFTEAEVRAVVIVDARQKIVGLVTQTDLLNAIARTGVANLSRPAGSAAA